MQTPTKTKNPLFDALGLPFSPEISWETMTSTTSGAVKLTGEIIKETVTSVTGGGLDMKANLTFNEPKTKPEVDTQVQTQLEKENYFRNYNIISEASKVVEDHEAELAAKTQVRYEIAGMDDEEFAKEAGYKNVGFRAFLRTIRNFVDVFNKRVETILKRNREESTPVAIIGKRLGAKMGGFMGENELLLGGENKQHFTNLPG